MCVMTEAIARARIRCGLGPRPLLTGYGRKIEHRRRGRGSCAVRRDWDISCTTVLGMFVQLTEPGCSFGCPLFPLGFFLSARCQVMT